MHVFATASSFNGQNSAAHIHAPHSLDVLFDVRACFELVIVYFFAIRTCGIEKKERDYKLCKKDICEKALGRLELFVNADDNAIITPH